MQCSIKKNTLCTDVVFMFKNTLRVGIYCLQIKYKDFYTNEKITIDKYILFVFGY